MISRVDLCCAGKAALVRREAEALKRVYPWLPVTCDEAPAADAVPIHPDAWLGPDFDPFAWDRAVGEGVGRRGSVSFRIEGAVPPSVCGAVALQVVTRYQRFLVGRNRASAEPLFDRALGLHRALHDRCKPLVAADHDHALDTWRWVLRLCPEASLAVQLAALFHDVERLISESEVRVEQHSSDYRAFKEAHAAVGARLVAQVLRDVDAPAPLIGRVVDLVREHEHPGEEADMLLLNEADALSFFSLNACGFLAYYGLEHTRRKVAYTFARLRERGLAELPRLRLRDDLRRLVHDVGGRPGGRTSSFSSTHLPGYLQ